MTEGYSTTDSSPECPALPRCLAVREKRRGTSHLSCGVIGAPRSRRPNEHGAWAIADALYRDLGSVDWIPSDDADVFRLTFTSNREPRILKLPTAGIPAVWREISAFPAMRRLGIPEVLEFEHTSAELPDLGIEFHITRELENPQLAGRAMADLWATEPSRALDVAHWLGDCTRRIESLDWRRVPRANSPEQSIEDSARWWKPHVARVVARPDCPAWVHDFVARVSKELTRPPEAFGGWGGELLRAPDGRFVLIDWPALGAATPGSLAALALEVLLRFRATEAGPARRAVSCRLGSGRSHREPAREPTPVADAQHAVVDRVGSRRGRRFRCRPHRRLPGRPARSGERRSGELAASSAGGVLADAARLGAGLESPLRSFNRKCHDRSFSGFGRGCERTGLTAPAAPMLASWLQRARDGGTVKCSMLWRRPTTGNVRTIRRS
jgi:hypothetical protein